MKILWLSRHDLTRAQEERLMRILPEEERDKSEIVCRMHVWQTTEDENADNEANARAWLSLNQEADVIAGIFPPTALVGLIMARGERDDGNPDYQDFKAEVMTPVSQIGNVLRNGKCEKRMTFLRWQKV